MRMRFWGKCPTKRLTHSPWICFFCCVYVCVVYVAKCVSVWFFADFGLWYSFRRRPFTNVDSVVILSLFFFFLTTSLILSIKEADKSVFLFFIFSLKFMHWINQYNRCFAVFNSLEMNTINWIFCCKTKKSKKNSHKNVANKLIRWSWSFVDFTLSIEKNLR